MERNVKQDIMSSEVLNSLRRKDGQIDMTRLQDYVIHSEKIKATAGKVYSVISKGLLTHSDYNEDTVLKVYKNLQESQVNREQVYEDMMHLTADVPEIQQLVKEYFGKVKE